MAARACQFCDSSFSVGFSALEEPPDLRTQGISTEDPRAAVRKITESNARAAAHEPGVNPAWRGDLAHRLRAYRARRRKLPSDDVQSHFSFEDTRECGPASGTVAIAEMLIPAEDDFSFTIAIGRPSEKKALEDSAMEIDVSSRPTTEATGETAVTQQEVSAQASLFPVASIDERRLAGIIDLFCLLFAYGGILGLFGSLGGHFTFSKLSVAVCAAIFAAVYSQYFALFTIFGGTTPGMMMRGLQVVSFSGEPPTPKQMLLRSAGYLLSAGTFFLGFVWAMWDADELTWHDHLSRTYLSVEQTLPDLEATQAARSR